MIALSLVLVVEEISAKSCEMSRLVLILCVLVALASGHDVPNRMEEVYRWKQMGYDQLSTDSDGIAFPDEDEAQLLRSERQSALSANYVAYNNVPMGVTHYRDRLFITVPRRNPGIPATLNFISVKSSIGSSPTLRAYPSYRVNELNPGSPAPPDSLVSVYRTRVDACNRLWFIDTGLLEYRGNHTQVQRPSIWVMDLETDTLVRRFEIPESIVALGNGLASITVDVNRNQCDRAFAYIPDLAYYRLYTYDFEQNRMWSFSHNFFNFDPTQGDFIVGGQQFQWNDGIFSITLGKRNADGFRTAYFHPMVSIAEFAVSTRVLRNSTAAERSNHGADFVQLGQRGANTQSAMHDYDPNSGIMFYSQVATNGVGCWDTNKPFSAAKHTLIHRNDNDMIYPSDLNVDSEGIVWVLSNSMPIFIYSTLDPNVYNFRVWKVNARDAVFGTVCQPKRS